MNSFSGTNRATKIPLEDLTTKTLNGLPILLIWPGLSKVSTPQELMVPTSTEFALQKMRTSFALVMTHVSGESSTTLSGSTTSLDATVDTPNMSRTSSGMTTTNMFGLLEVKT